MHRLPNPETADSLRRRPHSSHEKEKNSTGKASQSPKHLDDIKNDGRHVCATKLKRLPLDWAQALRDKPERGGGGAGTGAPCYQYAKSTQFAS